MDLLRQLSLPLFDLWPSLEPKARQPLPSREPPSSSAPPSSKTPTLADLGLRKRSVVAPNLQLIEFGLKRGKRRTIGFIIDERGLTVSAPKWVSLGEIDAAVIEKSHWIARKQSEWRHHQSRRLAELPQWEDGGHIKFLGEKLTIRVRADLTGVRKVDSEVLVGLPSDVDSIRIKDSVQAWLQTQARVLFAERLERLAMLTGKAPKRWALSSAKTRWGSCTSDGTIRLNWRLMHFPLDAIDYVIAHELAHLSEMNHGPKFWDKVAQIIPNYENARSQLTGITDDM